VLFKETWQLLGETWLVRQFSNYMAGLARNIIGKTLQQLFLTTQIYDSSGRAAPQFRQATLVNTEGKICSQTTTATRGAVKAKFDSA
jgi:hypothetical protein